MKITEMRITLLLATLVLVAGCVQQETNQTGSPFLPSPFSPPKQPANPDDGLVGSLNHGYLQAGPYSKIIIEIDYVEGYEPRATTKNAIRNFFDAFGKDVTFSGGNVIAQTKGVYSESDLLSTEKANRNHHTSGDTAVVYYMFLNGNFDNTGAIGVAYKASSAALFAERIDDATTALILYSQIEKATAMHELGHLMGLVNINYESARDHEDPDHRGHSRNEDSVMFWAVEDVSLKNLLKLGPPSGFDDDDMFDLQKIRDGVY